MKLDPPFFHDENDIKKLIEDSRPNQLVWGGPSLGKTTCLRWLQRQLEAQSKRCLWVDPLTPIPITVEAGTRALLIDSLDRIVRDGRQRDALVTLIKVVNDSHREIETIATGRTDAGTMIGRLPQCDEYDFISDWLAQFHQIRLEPWASSHWRLRLHQALHPHLAASDLGEIHSEVLIGLSGGHPALLSAGFEYLHSASDSLRDQPREVVELRLADAMLPRAHALATRLVDGLHKPPDQSADPPRTQREALASLTALVQQVPQRPSTFARHLLQKSGLVRKSGAELRIPGSLLREVFTALLDESPQEILRVRGSATHGELVWIRADRPNQQAEIEGKVWQVACCLAQARHGEGPHTPQWLSPRTIATHAQTTDTYVRVVIRRLREQLQADGDALIVTDRSRGGYRIAPRVSIEVTA